MSQHLEVTLASLNSHGGRGTDGTPFDLAAACHTLAAAVTLLQECWHGDREADPLPPAATELGAGILRADLPAGVDLPPLSISGQIRRGGWGLAILTTLPTVSSEVLALGRAPGDKYPRAAQLVTVALPGGGRLRVVNTHLTHRFTVSRRRAHEDDCPRREDDPREFQLFADQPGRERRDRLEMVRLRQRDVSGTAPGARCL